MSEIYKCECKWWKQLQRLKAERDLLLNQLVVLDGEDVIVQVTQEQFEEYNKLKAENEKLKEQIKSNSFGMFNIQMAECLDKIEEIARTLGNQNDVKHRLNDKDIQKLLKIDDDLLSTEEIMRKYILQLIKQTKKGAK